VLSAKETPSKVHTQKKKHQRSHQRCLA